MTDTQALIELDAVTDELSDDHRAVAALEHIRARLAALSALETPDGRRFVLGADGKLRETAT